MSIKPKGKQLEVLALPIEGHTVVLGTAGSGKTTIALLRAEFLAKIPQNGNVLVITFNGALVEYMKEIAPPGERITVENYHTFARGYLNFRGKMDRTGSIANNETREFLIRNAVEELKKENTEETTYRRPIAFFMDEIKFIEEFGCDTFEKYNQIERTGRADANLRKEKRSRVFDVYKRYLKLREQKRIRYDWYDIAFYVNEELKLDKTERLYRHIIVDEGQDFSPMMIKSLINAIPINGSFTFFGDVAQQIYGNRISWKESGINTSKIWRFDVNYRNPKTIIEFAKELTNSKYWNKSDDMVECIQSNAIGPKPILIRFNSIESEQSWVIRRAISESKKASVVIVCRNRNDIDNLNKKLSIEGCKPIVIQKNTTVPKERNQVYLSTFHAVKGLEFYNVFIPYLTEDKIPDSEMVECSVNKENVYYNELKLLYVAVTRSRYGLYMTYSGKLTPLYPSGTDKADEKRL